MIRRPKAKWIAPVVLTGALLAGGTAAIAAETWNSSDEDSPVELPFRRKASEEDMQARKAEMQARKAEMQERLAAKVESGEITQAEADDFRAKMADRKAKFEQRRDATR